MLLKNAFFAGRHHDLIQPPCSARSGYYQNTSGRSLVFTVHGGPWRAHRDRRVGVSWRSLLSGPHARFAAVLSPAGPTFTSGGGCLPSTNDCLLPLHSSTLTLALTRCHSALFSLYISRLLVVSPSGHLARRRGHQLCSWGVSSHSG